MPDVRTEALGRAAATGQFDGRGVTFTHQLLTEVIGAVQRTFVTASFAGATFPGKADFSNVKFVQIANFDGTRFAGIADFSSVHCKAGAYFRQVIFEQKIALDAMRCDGVLDLTGSRFVAAGPFGPIACDELVLNHASFEAKANIEVAAVTFSCQEASFSTGALVSIRHAFVDLGGATFGGPIIISGARSPLICGEPSSLSTSVQVTDTSAPKVVSLRGVDASKLSLRDVDLTKCSFIGVHGLDELTLSGLCSFKQPPHGIRHGRAFPGFWWWSRRQTLAEEGHWRSQQPKGDGWSPAPVVVPPYNAHPEYLATLYRAIRKAQEDRKFEPGAADFYYGEMEMRRLASSSPWHERVLLRLYWLLSGYGLRASRSFLAMAAVVTITALTLIGGGLPASGEPTQRLTGALSPATPGGTLNVDGRLVPLLPKAPPVSQRWTWKRADRATRIALGTVVFRDASQPLTQSGAWAVLAARFLGPLLLAMGLLSIRARIKR
jgi:uncharacterized protein YjbI with pentapeptide repeats